MIADVRPSENASAEEKAAALVAGGVKYDGDKARFDLIPSEMLWELARLYTIGARKYSDNNWRRGAKYGRWYAALQRHANAFWMGEEYDDGPGGSGCHHLIAVIWNATALYVYRKLGMNEFDDRPHVAQVNEKPIEAEDVRMAIRDLRHKTFARK